LTDFFEYFVRNLFDRLEASGLRWCVLRNYEGLPQKNTGHDLDINIDGGWSDTVERILQEVCRDTNTYVHRINYIQYCRGYIFSRSGESGAPWYLQIDIHDSEDYWGLSLIRQEILLSHRMQYKKKIWIPHPVHEGILNWLFPLLYGGFIKEKYTNKILSAYDVDKNFFKWNLVDICGTNLATSLTGIIEDGNIQATVKYRKKIISTLLIRRLFDCPKHVLMGLFKTVHYALTRRILPPGIWAVLLCDGMIQGKIDIQYIMKILHSAFVASSTTCIEYENMGVEPKNFFSFFFQSWKVYFTKIHNRTNRFGCVLSRQWLPNESDTVSRISASLLRIFPRPGIAIIVYEILTLPRIASLRNTLESLKIPVVLIQSSDMGEKELALRIIGAISNAKHNEFLRQKKLPTFRSAL